MTVGSDGKPVLKHFNTSHVTVYRTERVRRNRFFLISIHPMLRFIPHFFTIDTFLSNISIHPMLRFICSVLLFIGLLITISIHPMLRFISKEALKLNVAVGFQYIPCYGLSTKMLNPMQMLGNFNTSHVTVYQQWSYSRCIN